MAGLILRNGRQLGAHGLRDFRILDGVVADIGPGGSLADQGDEPIDLDGRTVAPGLWDEHVHLTQLAIQSTRIDLAGTTSAADVLGRVRDDLSRRPPLPGSIVTGYGFRDGVWPDEPSLASLDAISGDTPVVLISGDLHCAWMNSAAGRRYGIEPDAFGLLREGPWLDALRDSPEQNQASIEMFAAVEARAASRGVVGVVEFENADNIGEWPTRVDGGVDSLRIEVAVWADRLESAIAAGHRTGDILDSRGLITMGPLKVIVDGSLNTRTALCWEPYPGTVPPSFGVTTVEPSTYRELMRRVHDNGIGSAIHAIGDRANTEVLDAYEALGIGGRIEHAQLLRQQDIERFSALGVVASVQPEHAMDDREVADLYWAGRTDRAFALASLSHAGATLRFGSDSPVAPLDPWIAIAAAVTRSRDGKLPWHAEQAVPLDVALAASMRGRTSVSPGDVADLAILDADPYSVPEADLRALPIGGTLLAGRWTHRTL